MLRDSFARLQTAFVRPQRNFADMQRLSVGTQKYCATVQDPLLDQDTMAQFVVTLLLARKQREEPEDDDGTRYGGDNLAEATCSSDAQQGEEPTTNQATECTDDEVDETTFVLIATNATGNVSG